MKRKNQIGLIGTRAFKIVMVSSVVVHFFLFLLLACTARKEGSTPENSETSGIAQTPPVFAKHFTVTNYKNYTNYTN